MASIRSLKKDIQFVTNEIIIECFTLDYLFPKKTSDELASIIADTIQFKQNTLKAINSVSNTSNQPVKNQFKNIRLKMQAEINELVGRMEKLSK